MAPLGAQTATDTANERGSAAWTSRIIQQHPSCVKRVRRAMTEIYAVLGILTLLFWIFMLKFKKAWQGVNAYVATVLLALLVRDVIFVDHVLPRMLIQPSPHMIADTFVEAITAGDLDLALGLTDGTPDCVANMTRTFEWYSPTHLGVPVDELFVSHMWYTANPSQEMIHFTFSDRHNWPTTAGVVTLPTTYSMFGKRYTCGATFRGEAKSP